MDDTKRREPGKTFEPPPWEREQFEELARKKADQGEEPPPDVSHVETPATEEPQPQREELAATVPEVEAGLESGATPEAEKQVGPSESEMTAMFAQLRVEEPRRDPVLWGIGLAFSGISMVIGAVLLVWGAVALFTAAGEYAKIMGGAILAMFGAMFVGVGAWMAVRSLKQRGVL